MGATSFLESLLKWASVAYALGFVTVMVNTARIGVPTLQLIDPIQIWVGIPLALVFWLVFGAAKHYRKRAALVANDIQKQEAEFKQLFEVAKTGDLVSVMGKFFEMLDQVPGLGFWPFFVLARMQSNWFKRMCDRLAVRIKPGRDADSDSQEKQPDEVMPLVIELTRLLARVYVWGDYLTSAFYVGVLLLGASVVYVVFVYPIVPQSWGGGKPTIVRMSIDKERISPDENEFQSLFPPQKSTIESPKSPLSGPLTLLYSTEHAYYIRLSNGKVMQINPEAVSAIIFDGRMPGPGPN
jgi:hypothetical protein